MSNSPTKPNLPPLQVGRAYQATDFNGFEYRHHSTIPQSEQKSIFRIHLSNGTTIDLPATDEQLKHLAIVLTEAFGPHVIAHLKSRGWVGEPIKP